MSTSLLYHAWGIRGYTYVHARHEKGSTIFRVKQKSSEDHRNARLRKRSHARRATKDVEKVTMKGREMIWKCRKNEILLLSEVTKLSHALCSEHGVKGRALSRRAFDKFHPDLIIHDSDPEGGNPSPRGWLLTRMVDARQGDALLPAN
uniref:Uncharacterized protein n=1 Tax=Candidatus Kentrum sp. SD TaxID=2126332 RepID=A0A451BKL2_9GAMM|nr:MAG: hypothetical protein BECKSD772F_GA0070984_102715 [Candidatus Kentron sp. SD]VFK43413.1 MAG: hypothetical protein BECKSD772E_GA0070983_102514 [Candidatus Kentron sp. SD]VFK78849.1 MAG: hypothetical protein BECKSD772D_GA0070982_102718 [Candidatus Kentron sp. SD]